MVTSRRDAMRVLLRRTGEEKPGEPRSGRTEGEFADQGRTGGISSECSSLLIAFMLTPPRCLGHLLSCVSSRLERPQGC